MNIRETKAAVNRGAKLLNRCIPKWKRLIDKDELDMGDKYTCILGQVFGEDLNGLHPLNLDESDLSYYGLLLYIDEDDLRYDSEYAKLTELWKEVV